jgi:iron complex transport system substrate-binding protein
MGRRWTLNGGGKMRIMTFAIVLLTCASLVATPATASDYKLGIFGDANMDDTINEDDIEYVEGIIEGTNEVTDLADADYDGDVDEDDAAQIELIMQGEEKELTLIDMADRIVTIPWPIERVVSTSLGTTRIIVALDGCDRLKGSEIDSSGNGDWAGASCVGELQFACGGAINEVVDVGWGGTNVETIAMLEPDVIFGSESAATSLQDKIGAPVVVSSPTRTENMTMMEQWSQQIRCVGVVLGRDAEAEDLISFMDEKLAMVTDISSQIDDDEKPRVYFASRAGSHIYDIIQTTGYYDPIELAGGINVAREDAVDTSEFTVSKEQIVVWDPDIILLKCHRNNPPSETQYTREMALSDQLFQDGGVNAVVSGEVVYCMATCRGYPIERYIPETMYLAKIFHPAEFADLDLEKEGNEILEKFCHEDGLYSWLADDRGYIRDLIENPPDEGNW